MIVLAPPLRRPLVVTPHGAYGMPRALRKGVHRGLDFQADAGEDVIAVAAGTVARVGFDPPVKQGGGGGGNFVITRHTDDKGAVFEVGYMHLEQQDVRAGDQVSVGEVLGAAGATGTADGGVHLHFQVNQLVGSTKLPIDPTGALLPKPSSGAGVGLVVASAVVWLLRKVLF